MDGSSKESLCALAGAGLGSPQELRGNSVQYTILKALSRLPSFSLIKPVHQVSITVQGTTNSIISGNRAFRKMYTGLKSTSGTKLHGAHTLATEYLRLKGTRTLDVAEQNCPVGGGCCS